MSLESTTPVGRTPLPKLQLAVVLLVQLAEPLTATVIYPFVPEFVRRTGITGGDETKTGYYAGLIESAFFIAECLSVYHWGRAADYFGRRPILLLGPLGLSLSMLGFGLSNNFWFLVLFRCLQGIFNGNIGVSKTVVAEITDRTNIGDAYTIMPLMWGFGTTIGPVIGGLLADPAERWPVFGRLPIFRDHPYLLPCAVTSALSFSSFLVTYIVLKETLPSRQKHDPALVPLLIDIDPRIDYGTQTVPPEPRKPTFSEVANNKLLLVIVNFCFLSFNTSSYDVLLPLMYSTSIPVGGLGLKPFQIGTIMFVWGATNAILQVCFGGWIIRTLGPRKAFTLSLASMLVSFSAFSMESYLARHAGYINWHVMAFMGIQLTFNLLVSTAFGAGHVLVVQNATSQETMGSTNGLAQMANSGVRGLAPYLSSSLFSVTLQRRLLGGFLVYIVYAASMAGSIWTSLALPKGMM